MPCGKCAPASPGIKQATKGVGHFPATISIEFFWPPVNSLRRQSAIIEGYLGVIWNEEWRIEGGETDKLFTIIPLLLGAGSSLRHRRYRDHAWRGEAGRRCGAWWCRPRRGRVLRG